MKVLSIVIMSALVLVPLLFGLKFDWDLYLFNRQKYLIAQMSKKCLSVDMERANYIECKQLDSQLANKCVPEDMESAEYLKCKQLASFDIQCEYINASVIEKSGQCEEAAAAVRAETYRQIAKRKFESLSDK